MMEHLHLKSWHPDKPASKGATAFHDAVAQSTWIRDIIFELTNIVKPRINDKDIVVDFGAGTGTSAIELLKNIDKDIKLWLVDNSHSWLAKAYEILHHNPNVEFFILEKKDEKYATLAETIGKEIADHVISANTFHLVPDLDETFEGISQSLKKKGTFSFQTGNFMREHRPKGALMIDDTVRAVHDLALEMIKSDERFSAYRNGLQERIDAEKKQRKFVFPEPRHIDAYLKALKNAGFRHEKTMFIPVKIRYDDWLNFLRVRRLEAGILPEVGGKEASPQEEHDRDILIKESALRLFKDLRENNPLADDKCFKVECVYVLSEKE